MYLYYANKLDAPFKAAQEAFGEISLEERTQNMLINLGMSTTCEGFKILSEAICERVLEDPKSIATGLSTDSSSKANQAIKAAYRKSHLALTPTSSVITSTSKKFLDFTSRFLKNNEDFSWYFQVYPTSLGRYIATSLISNNFGVKYSKIKYPPLYLGIDTRIERLLNNFSITNEAPHKCWKFLLKEAFHGEYLNIRTCAEKMGLPYITVYQNLYRTLNAMTSHPAYTEVVHRATFSCPPTVKPNIDTSVLILASYLRRNMDALWYL